MAEFNLKLSGGADQWIAGLQKAANEARRLDLQAQKIDLARQREARVTADAIAREAKRAADATIREQTRAESEARKLDGERTRAAASLAAQRSRALQKELADEQRARAALDAQRSRALLNEYNAQQRAGQSTGALMSSVTGLAAGYVGLNAVLNTATEILGLYGAAASKTAQEQSRLADEFVKQRDAMREITSMEGGQATSARTIKQAQFAAAAAMTLPESQQFTAGLLGSGAQFIGPGKSMSQAQADIFAAKVAELGVIKGVDPSTMGNLAGGALGARDYSKFGAKGGVTALGDVNQSLAIMERGKGTVSEMARQLQMLSAAGVNEKEMMGVFKTQQEAATALSVMAEFNPQEAFVYVQNTNKFLRDFNDKKIGPLLKRAGITPQTGFEQSLRKLAPVMMAEAAQKKVPLSDVIASYTEDIRSQRGLETGISRGVEGGVFEDRAKYGLGFAGPGAALATIEAAEADPTGAVAARKSAGVLDVAEKMRGAETATYKQLRDRAIGQLKSRKMIDTAETNRQDQALDWAMKGEIASGFALSTREIRINEEMDRIMGEAARRAGVPGPEGRSDTVAQRMDELARGNVLFGLAGRNVRELGRTAFRAFRGDPTLMTSEQGQTEFYNKQLEALNQQGINPLTGQRFGPPPEMAAGPMGGVFGGAGGDWATGEIIQSKADAQAAETIQLLRDIKDGVNRPLPAIPAPAKVPGPVPPPRPVGAPVGR